MPGNVKLWDVATGEEQTTLTGPRASMGPVRFSPDGKRIAVPGWDGKVWLWDAKTLEPQPSLEAGSGVLKIAFLPDNETLATAEMNGSVALWDLKTAARRVAFEGHTAHTHALACSRDGSVIASSGKDRVVKLWPGGKGR